MEPLLKKIVFMTSKKKIGKEQIPFRLEKNQYWLLWKWMKTMSNQAKMKWSLIFEKGENNNLKWLSERPATQPPISWDS